MGNTLTIFDLDNTLIQGDSSTVWSQFMVREGLATQKGYLAREARLMADYDRGEMNIADYVALIQAPLAGIPKSDVDALVARCVREAILPRVYPQAWELIRRLRAEGEQMLIISASVSLLVQAVAAALGSIRRWVLTWRWSTAATAVKSPGSPAISRGRWRVWRSGARRIRSMTAR